MSRSTCAAKTCYNSYRNKPFLKFFYFPKEADTSIAWATHCDRLDILETPIESRAKSFTLCAEHFEDYLFLNPKFKTKFRCDVVPIPTIFKNNLLEFVPKSLKEKLSKVIVDDENKIDQHLEVTLTEIESSQLEVDDSAEDVIQRELPEPEERVLFDVCRLCGLNVSKDTSKHIFLSSNNSILEMIDYFLPAKANEADGLPQYMCNSCESKLLYCHETIKSFIMVDEEFRKRTLELDNIDEPITGVENSSEFSEKCNFAKIHSYKLEECKSNNLDHLSNTVEDYSNLKDDDMSYIENEDFNIVEVSVIESLQPEKKFKNIMLKCAFCPAEFNSEKALICHKKQVHSAPKGTSKPKKTKGLVNCSECDLLIVASKLKSHMANHLPKENQCEYCGAQYKTLKGLESHLSEHVDDLFCSFCGKEFSTMKNKWNHVKTHRLQPGILCEICGRMLSDLRGLDIHLRVHEKEGEYSCLSCKKSFATEAELDRHTSSHTKEFLCPVCLKGFHLKKFVRQHMLSHSGVSPFSCYCGASFNRHGNLWNHMKKHNHFKVDHKAALHECLVCKRKLKSKLKLKWHLAKHAGDKKPYDCEICDSRFSTFSYYKTHMLIHTGERPYKCTICGNSFRTMPTLKQHKLIHKNEFPHHCDMCTRSFKRLHSLIIHKRTHTGERPHHCSICQRNFLQKPDLLRHLKTHAKDLRQIEISIPTEDLSSSLQPITDMVPAINNSVTASSNITMMLENLSVDVTGQFSPGNMEFIRYMFNTPAIEIQQPSLNFNLC